VKQWNRVRAFGPSLQWKCGPTALHWVKQWNKCGPSALHCSESAGLRPFTEWKWTVITFTVWAMDLGSHLNTPHAVCVWNKVALKSLKDFLCFFVAFLCGETSVGHVASGGALAPKWQKKKRVRTPIAGSNLFGITVSILKTFPRNSCFRI